MPPPNRHVAIAIGIMIVSVSEVATLGRVLANNYLVRLFRIAEYARAVSDDHMRIMQSLHRIVLMGKLCGAMNTFWVCSRHEPTATRAERQVLSNPVQDFLRWSILHECDFIFRSVNHIGATIAVKMRRTAAHAT